MVHLAGFALSILVPLLALALIHRSPHCPPPKARLRRTVYGASATAFFTALASAAFVLWIGTGDGGLVARATATWRVLPILALLEELSRFVVLRFYSLRGAPAPGARAGILYGLAAGLAFALLENIMTFGGPSAASPAAGWLRVALASPLHMLLGGLMGFLLVRARGAGALRLVAAIALPTAIHVLYDAPVLIAVARYGQRMSLELAAGAVAVSAAVVLVLALAVYALFRRAGPASAPLSSQSPPAW
jgi:RsiW-degrading membrane proteinase PrsW (M82 family)